MNDRHPPKMRGLSCACMCACVFLLNFSSSLNVFIFSLYAIVAAVASQLLYKPSLLLELLQTPVKRV